MKRVKVLAAALPAAVGLAAPVTAAAATTTAAATVPTAHGKKVTYPEGTFVNLRSANPCAFNDGTSKFSCMLVLGNGQFLSELQLSHWINKNGGTRTGFISYRDGVTHQNFPDFRTRTKSEPKGVSYSFAWNTQCHLPHPGVLRGKVGGHSAVESAGIHSGTTTGRLCSGA